MGRIEAASEPTLLKPPQLKTARLVLRPFESADVEALLTVLTEWRDITPMIGWPVVDTKPDADAVIQRMAGAEQTREQMFWAIEVDGRLAGSVFFVKLDLQAKSWHLPAGMLGYWMAGEYRDQGYVTEATRAVISYGFTDLHLHKIKIGHVHINDKSRRVIEKLGFRPVGVERQEFCWDSQSPPVWYDHHIYEMLASQWDAAG
jgi:[ribosomal protein S5]-alanine N-acetyltransferase